MTKDKTSTNQLIDLIVEGIEKVKGKDVTLLDLSDIDSAVCDYFVVCTGTSNTHVNAIAASIQKTVSKAIKDKPWHVEGSENAEWILMDYIDVVVHVFQKQIREYYDIESLWGDAKSIAIEGN